MTNYFKPQVNLEIKFAFKSVIETKASVLGQKMGPLVSQNTTQFLKYGPLFWFRTESKQLK